MNFLKSLLNKIKSEPDIWFFYGFLLFFTLSVRKVLFYFPIERTFNEYTGIYVYMSDILLFLCLFSWFIFILCNKRVLLSNINLWINALFHNLYLFIPFILVIWSFISIVWSSNEDVAIFKSLKLLEVYLLYLYLVFRFVPRGTFSSFSQWKKFILFFIGLGVIQSILGIIQVISQKAIGLFFLKESIIDPSISGVAKIVLDGQKYIRAYGLFPHPNILAGFLVISIILTLLYLKLFHVEQNNKEIVPRGTISNLFGIYLFAKKKLISGNSFIKILLAIESLGFILTLSKSAILGLVIALSYIYWKIIVPRGTIKDLRIKKLFHVEQLRISIPALLILLVSLFLILKPNFNFFFIQSLNERTLYLNVSRGTILENPILGIGIGQFVIRMQNFSSTILQNWQYQPVHNVFLLIWSELGLIGLALFIWLLKIMFHVEHFPYSFVPRGIMEKDRKSVRIVLIYFKGILLGLLFIMIFDHYLWDIQQGEIILWIILGLIAGIINVLAEDKERLLT